MCAFNAQRNLLFVPCNRIKKCEKNLDIKVTLYFILFSALKAGPLLIADRIESVPDYVKIYLINLRLRMKPVVNVNKFEISLLDDNIKKISDESEQAIAKAKELSVLMLDASPFCCEIWDKDLNVLDCNEATIRFLGLGSKEEYMNNLYDFSPEYQPDGQRSDEKTIQMVKKGFEEGRQVFQWQHILADGTHVPVEITLVPIKYEDDDAIVVYTRDLREHHIMMEEINYRDVLLEEANRASAFLLDANDKSFDINLLKAMEIVAKAIDIDRIYLWKNSIKNGAIRCNQIFEWPRGTRTEIENKLLSDLSYEEFMPGLEAILSSGNSINIMVRDAAPGFRESLTQQGIKSIIVIPIFIENKFWGIASYDDCICDRNFTETEIMTLRASSLQFANAWLRKEMYVNLQDASTKLEIALEHATTANKNVEVMLDKSPFMCILFDENCKILDCNQEALEILGISDKSKLINNPKNFYPKLQPDGMQSVAKYNEIVSHLKKREP
jgi:PAS domain-containing protein